jgi:putative RNA 2'-phosphotransferase
MAQGVLDNRLLLRTLARALRHVPWQYFLEVDSQGWADLDCVLLAMRYDRPEWSRLAIDDIARLCGPAGAERFQIAGGRIRALYGHSVVGVMAGIPAEPPDLLHHGTDAESVSTVRSVGLLPIHRRFVHLTSDVAYARAVSAAHADVGEQVVLVVRAHDAWKGGQRFFRANGHVWLTDALPPRFIQFPA